MLPIPTGGDLARHTNWAPGHDCPSRTSSIIQSFEVTVNAITPLTSENPFEADHGTLQGGMVLHPHQFPLPLPFDQQRFWVFQKAFDMH